MRGEAFMTHPNAVDCSIMGASGRRAARAVLRSFGVAAAALAAWGVPAATAGTYTVWSCKTPSGTPTTTENWARAMGIPGMLPTDDCASGGQLSTNFAGTAPSVTFQGNQRMGWEFTAPTDTTVADVRAEWGFIVGHNGADTNASAAVGIYRDGFAWPAGVLWQCQAYYAGGSYCYSGGGTSDLAINARTFGFDAGCYGEASGTCQGDPNGKSVQGWGATRIHLDDPYPPSVGSLTGNAATAATLAGSQPVTAALSDRGAGLWQSELRLGSVVLQPRTTLSTNGGKCVEVNVDAAVANEFGRPQPCALGYSGTWTVDTTKVPDGNHTLTLTVWDAANNATTVVSRTVAVRNATAPTTPTSASTAASTAAAISLSSAAVTVGYGGKPKLTGRLVDAAGAPIGGAKVDVLERIAYAGAEQARVATIDTDADGQFSYQEAARSSRILTFAYAAKAGTTDYVASADFALKVRSRVQFHSPAKAVRHGSQVVFTGRVLAQPLPKKGARVAIEVRIRGHWQPAALVRASQAGTFTWRRTLRGITTYQFRARVLGGSDFPAEPSTSRTIRLRLT
jgi:hypothetical protein